MAKVAIGSASLDTLPRLNRIYYREATMTMWHCRPWPCDTVDLDHVTLSTLTMWHCQPWPCDTVDLAHVTLSTLTMWHCRPWPCDTVDLDHVTLSTLTMWHCRPRPCDAVDLDHVKLSTQRHRNFLCSFLLLHSINLMTHLTPYIISYKKLDAWSC